MCIGGQKLSNGHRECTRYQAIELSWPSDEPRRHDHYKTVLSNLTREALEAFRGPAEPWPEAFEQRLAITPAEEIARRITEHRG
jgi:hypothetical protein